MNAGYVPTVFHRSNTKQEKQREEKAAAKLKTEEVSKLDPEAQAASDKIEAYLKQHMRSK